MPLIYLLFVIRDFDAYVNNCQLLSSLLVVKQSYFRVFYTFVEKADTIALLNKRVNTNQSKIYTELRSMIHTKERHPLVLQTILYFFPKLSKVFCLLLNKWF